MYRRLTIILIVIIMSLLAACQTDKNTVGVNFNPEPVNTETTVVDTAFCFSYDQELSVYTGELEMLCAEYEDITSICLLSFYNMPTEIDSISDAVLSISIYEEKSDFDIASLKLGKIKKLWDETATWEHPDADSSDVFWDVTTPEVINRDYLDVQFTQDEDSLAIVIPASLIETWKDDDLSNYNLAVFTDSGYLSLKSSETSYGPRLVFTYKTADEVLEYNKECLFDTYIIPEKSDKTVYENEIILQNINPIRNFIKFDIEQEVLSLDNITEDNLDKVLFNKAELIFTIDKTNCTFYDEQNEDMDELEVNLRWVNKNIETSELLESDDLDTSLDDIPYPYYLLTSSTIKMADSLAVIDISPIVSNFLKDRLDNNGFVLVSNDESQFFGKISLFGFDAPADKKPRLKILYTLPEMY